MSCDQPRRTFCVIGSAVAEPARGVTHGWVPTGRPLISASLQRRRRQQRKGERIREQKKKLFAGRKCLRDGLQSKARGETDGRTLPASRPTAVFVLLLAPSVRPSVRVLPAYLHKARGHDT